MDPESSSQGADLFALVAAGRPSAVQAALAAGAVPDQRDRYGATPLYWAAASGEAAMVEALLAAGADPNARSGVGNSPLMVAAAAGATVVVRRLLAARADARHRNRWGYDAIRWSQWCPEPAAMRALLQSAPAALSGV